MPQLQILGIGEPRSSSRKPLFAPSRRIWAVPPKTKRPETFVPGLSITVCPQLPEPRIHPSGLLLRLRVSRSLVFQPCRRWFFESPRVCHLSAVPCSKRPGFPGFPLFQSRRSDASSGLPDSGIFRLCFGFKSQAFDASRFQVAPNSRSLLLLLHRRLILRASRFPRFIGLSHLPALPATQLRVSPMLSVLQLCQRRASRFPRILPSRLRRRCFSRFPRIRHPPVVPPPRLRVSPNPASAAGSTMTPRLDSNFASSA